MKRGFVRALWGMYKEDNDHYHRRKIDIDIEIQKHCKYLEPFTTYVFGKDNYEHLKSFNIEKQTLKLVSEEPIVWDMQKEQYRHKLEAFKCAMQDFDEMVFLDWDTFHTKSLPSNFWETLNKKDAIQATLIQYKLASRSSPYWRKNGGASWASGAAWLYMRDKTIPDKLIKIWEDLGRGWSEELAITWYIDSLTDGWKGLEEYEKRYEPDFFYHHRSHAQRRIHSKEFIAAKIDCFMHLGKGGAFAEGTLRNAKNIEWLQE